MAKPDSSDIDAALVDLLFRDPTLAALIPDGVYIDEAPPGKTRFGIVTIVDNVDVPVYGGRAYEQITYAVKAVMVSTAGGNVKAAAARIDEVLEDQPLMVAGYGWMTMYREQRVRLTEVDQGDPAIRWYHRGGHYRVQMALDAEGVTA